MRTLVEQLRYMIVNVPVYDTPTIHAAVAEIERLTAELKEKEDEIQRLWKLRLETLPT
jgi:hypothetical protein